MILSFVKLLVNEKIVSKSMTLVYEKLRLFTQEIYNMFISQYEV